MLNNKKLDLISKHYNMYNGAGSLSNIRQGYACVFIGSRFRTINGFVLDETNYETLEIA